MGDTLVWPAVTYLKIDFRQGTTAANAACPMPSGAQVGDICLFHEQAYQNSNGVVNEVYPAGFTKFTDSITQTVGTTNFRDCWSYKILEASDLSRTLIGMNNFVDHRMALLVRGLDSDSVSQPISVLEVLSETKVITPTAPANQLINASGFQGAGLLAYYGSTDTDIFNVNMGWTGTNAPTMILNSANRLGGKWLEYYDGIGTATITLADMGSCQHLSSFLFRIA
jgi:hypothetical protein